MPTKKKRTPKPVKREPAKREPAIEVSSQAIGDLSFQRLHPDYIYRLRDAPRLFGLSISIIHDKINTGEIPAPMQLSDSGRGVGWTGATILDWRKERQEAGIRFAEKKAKARAEAAAAREKKQAEATK